MPHQWERNTRTIVDSARKAQSLSTQQRVMSFGTQVDGEHRRERSGGVGGGVAVADTGQRTESLALRMHVYEEWSEAVSFEADGMSQY